MSKQQTLEAVRALSDAFRQLNSLLDKHIATSIENKNHKKAA